MSNSHTPNVGNQPMPQHPVHKQAHQQQVPQHQAQPVAQYSAPIKNNDQNKRKKPIIIILIAAILVVLLSSVGLFFFLQRDNKNPSSTDAANPPIVLPSCDKANAAAQADMAKGKQVETVKFSDTDVYKSMSETAQKIFQKSKASVACDWKLEGDKKVVQNISAINASEQDPLIQELRSNNTVVEYKIGNVEVFTQPKSGSNGTEYLTYTRHEDTLAVTKAPAAKFERYVEGTANALRKQPQANASKVTVPSLDKINTVGKGIYDEAIARGTKYTSPAGEISVNELKDYDPLIPEFASKAKQNRNARFILGFHDAVFVSFNELENKDKEELIGKLRADSGYKETSIRGLLAFESLKKPGVEYFHGFTPMIHIFAENIWIATNKHFVSSTLYGMFEANPHLPGAKTQSQANYEKGECGKKAFSPYRTKPNLPKGIEFLPVYGDNDACAELTSVVFSSRSGHEEYIGFYHQGTLASTEAVKLNSSNYEVTKISDNTILLTDLTEKTFFNWDAQAKKLTTKKLTP
ncbi:MAG: hypothetical protein Q4C71_02715 [Microbacteriaceae bacterium]|nr:hypothetical protein [Microbacteriaceae bacterium]